jgi:hypothetical protein
MPGGAQGGELALQFGAPLDGCLVDLQLDPFGASAHLLAKFFP